MHAHASAIIVNCLHVVSPSNAHVAVLRKWTTPVISASHSRSAEQLHVEFNRLSAPLRSEPFGATPEVSTAVTAGTASGAALVARFTCTLSEELGALANVGSTALVVLTAARSVSKTQRVCSKRTRT